MPPHCDALDGPVVKAAARALDQRDVEIVLPFVHADGEREVRDAFARVVEAREAGGVAREVVDRYFFETVVRIHRAGERAPFTGLKPAGLDHGPVIPVAERAIERGSADELLTLLGDELEHQVKERLDGILALQAEANRDLPSARRFTSAMLDLQVWANDVYRCLNLDPHTAHAEYERHQH